MKKLFIFAFSFLLTVHAKADTWAISKVEIYNGVTKKTQLIDKPRGEAFIDFINKFVTFPVEYEAGIFSFNACEDRSLGDNHVRYYLYRKDLSEFSNRYMTFDYSDSTRYDGYEGTIRIIYKDVEKTFYLSRKEPTMAGDEYLSYLRERFEEIEFDWHFVTNDSKNNLYFIKDEPINDVGNDKKVKIWIKALLKEVKIKGVTYKNVELKFIMNFDCANKQSMTEEHYYYKSNGDIIETQLGEYRWSYLVPESIGETLYKKVCAWFGG